ncbi:BREX-1 system phosphatase PglZ type A [Planktomarina temperata]|nr:BREX-1 system phosphatase PglZ type A [Planktomarina temperata]
MTEEHITRGLQAQFDRYRIVFWYDAKQELREAFDEVSLPDVAKIEIQNDEFSIKHRVLKQEPEQKFLIYKHGPEPEKLTDNWLLDVQMAHGVFQATQTQVLLAELGLDLGFADTLAAHEEFFRSKKRTEDLKAILDPEDDRISLRFKLLLIATGSDQDIEGVVGSLFAEQANQSDEIQRLLKRCNLEAFLWDQLERRYGYVTEEPSISDFALELFKSCFLIAVGGDAKLNSESQVLFRRWKNDKNNADTFEILSREFEEALNIKMTLAETDFRKIIDVDLFEQIDRYILRSMASELAGQHLKRADVENWVRTRRKHHWYDTYRHVYEALFYASEFLNEISQVSLGMDGFDDAISRYSKTWFKIDQLYRKFIHHLRKASQPTLLGDIAEVVENRYENDYLLRLNDAWQTHVDRSTVWKSETIPSQKDFYSRFVKKLRDKDTKAVVVISDAMRYEVGEELLRRIREQDKFDAQIEPTLSSLPSYTQLGMASLLPHEQLAISDPEKAVVSINGNPTTGLENRKKILASNPNGDRTAAWQATDFLELKSIDAKEIIRDHDILYIYHNVIDATGDSAKTEEKVFEAVEDALVELVTLVRKLTSANAGHIFVTADHGFIYQNRDLQESDYLSVKPEGDEILFQDRRFILGRGLNEHPSFKKFNASELGLDGDIEVLIPKSINRLRRKGSGAKYVHGGASLQEVIVPVLKINKGRQNDIALVDVSILTGATKTITTGQLSVRFYQEEAITEKIQPRKLRLGIYALDGTLLSDTHELMFDMTSSNPRDREQKAQLLLSKSADAYNNEEVVMRLDEQHAGTSHFKEYKSTRYTIKRSFSNDFDF